MRLDRVIAVRNNKTIYRDGDRVIKVFCAGYPKADVFNEAHNHACIEESGINVPKLLEVGMIDGKWAIVTEYIKGKTLYQLMQENPTKKLEYVELLVDVQMGVHEKQCPKLNKLKDKIDYKIKDCDLDATVRYNLHSRLEEQPKNMRVCHGDFNPSNVIIAEHGTPYILDWSHASQGNVVADVVKTYLLFLLDEDFSGAKGYIDLVCKKSKIQLKEIQSWLPLVAASQSIKCNEKARKFLLSKVNALDFE